MSYLRNRGKYQGAYDKLRQLIPDTGKSDSRDIEMFRILLNIYCDFHNDGINTPNAESKITHKEWCFIHRHASHYNLRHLPHYVVQRAKMLKAGERLIDRTAYCKYDHPDDRDSCECDYSEGFETFTETQLERWIDSLLEMLLRDRAIR